MADGDETTEGQDQPGGWLPPSAPGSGEAPSWNPAPPPRPEVEGLPPSDSPLAGMPTAPQQPPPPAYPAPPQYPPPGGPYPPQPPQGQWGPPQQQGWPQQPGWYQPPPSRPTNGSAVAALVLGIAGIAVTLMFAGFLFIVSIPCSIAAWVFGVKGKKVAAPDPMAEPMRPGGRGMAQAGLICGIVGLVLAVLAIIIWVLIFAAADWNFDEFEPENNEDLFQSSYAVARVIAPVARLLLGVG